MNPLDPIGMLDQAKLLGQFSKPTNLTVDDLSLALRVLREIQQTITVLSSTAAMLTPTREGVRGAIGLSKRLAVAREAILTAIGRDLEALLPDVEASVLMIEKYAKDLEATSRARAWGSSEKVAGG